MITRNLHIGKMMTPFIFDTLTAIPELPGFWILSIVLNKNWQTTFRENGVFWVVTPCGSCKNRRFGGIWRLLHQGDKNR
jgi:hypothetical protein